MNVLKTIFNRFAKNPLAKNIVLSTIILTTLLHNVKSQDTLHVHDNIFVPECDSMEIQPGTVVMFHGYYNIEVMGTFNAIGTEEEPIIFTASDTLGLYDTNIQEGGWNGIRFSGRTETHSVLNYCTFEYSKAGVYDFENGGVLSIIQPKDVLVENSVFRHNYAHTKGGAIYILGGSPKIKNSEFISNTVIAQHDDHYTYGGAVFIDESSAEVGWNTFTENYSGGMGGAIAIESADPYIYNNKIYNNDSPLGGGIGILRSNIKLPLINNLIIENHSLFFGGGIAFVEASAIVANSTILNNYAGYGGGLYFNVESAPKFYNCIIRNNMSYPGQINQVFIWDISAPEFYNSNIEGGLEGFDGGAVGEGFLGIYKDNIDEDPLFVQQGEHYYALNENSPCIDTGFFDPDVFEIYQFDLAGNNRYSGFGIDMGAYEYQHQYFELSIIVEGQGSTLPEEGSHSMPETAEVTLKAFPHNGWQFDYWIIEQDTVDITPHMIELMHDMNIKAVFNPSTFINEVYDVEVVVYPNPVESFINIRVTDCHIGKDADIILSDSNGRVLFREGLSFSQNEITLPYSFDKLPAGVYHLLMKTKNEIFSFSIVK